MHGRYLGRASRSLSGLKDLTLWLIWPPLPGLRWPILLALQLDKGPELRALSLAMGYWWAKGRVRRAHGRREWCACAGGEGAELPMCERGECICALGKKE